jgi:hypothetical protein
MSAFRFQGHDSAAGVIGRCLAMLGRKVARQTIKVTCGHRHAQSMAGPHECRLNRQFSQLFHKFMRELH